LTRLASAWLPPAAVAAGIFWLSSLPEPPLVDRVRAPDWVGHGTEYALLGALLVRAFRRTRPAWSAARAVVAAAAVAAAYGAGDEWHQSFVPRRTAEWADFAADALGGLAGAAAAGAAYRRRPLG